MVKLSEAIESFSAIYGLKKLFDVVCDGTMERMSMLLGVDEDIRKLKRDFEHIKNLLISVEEHRIQQQGLQDWLRDLKDLVYDAEDVVDEFETAVAKDPGLACSNNTNHKQGKFERIVAPGFFEGVSQFTSLAIKDVSSIMTDVASGVSRLTDMFHTNTAQKDDASSSKDDGCILVRLDIAKEIKKILEELQVLMERKRNFDLSVILSSTSAPQQEGGSQRSRRPQVGSRLDHEFEMVGRVKEREDLVKQLTEETNTTGSTVRSGARREKNVSVTSIVGMGGIGKSTLAQLVFQEVSSKFTLKKWLSVGESFDPKFLIAKLLEETINQDAELCDIQERLIGKVEGQRFLIVLDDVWNTSCEIWGCFWKPLSYGSKGSRVLITCRDKQVIQATGFKPTIELQLLKDDECLSVFLEHAFPEGDSDDYPDLKHVADKIVVKLKGLPLAAKVVGSSLFGNLDRQKWNNILEDELWANVEEGEDSIMNQLKWSYNLLPPHLKQCFGYCSIFPKDHNFHIQDDLVLKWMAAGLIQPQGSRRPEDIGMDYFQDLLQKSFFDRMKGRFFDRNEYYVMHDLIHDLAELVSSHECACYQRLKTVDSDTSSVRHLSLDTFTTGSPYNFQKVRTVLYTGRQEKVPDGLFNKLKYIRVLDLVVWRTSNRLSDVHAEQISRLKHLRYLGCQTENTIPKSFGELYNLQVLVVMFMDESCFDPIKGISDLSKLRHIQLYSLFATGRIESVGRLTALQSLEYFEVQKMAGFGIEELQCLAQLRGRLVISGLENVETKEEAEKSRLVDKKHLTKLKLHWNRRQTISQSEQKHILEALKPNPNLEKLTFDEYGGEQLPRWLTEASSLSSLKLWGCESLLFNDDNLFGNLIHLRNLQIECCSQFSNGLCGFITRRIEQNASVSFVLPNLESLSIDDTRLFSTFLGSGDRFCKASSLKEIYLWTGDQFCPGLWNENMQTEQLSRFTSLKILRFYWLKCSDMPSYLYLLPSLEELNIHFCDQILELPKYGLPKSLQVLDILSCPQLAPRCREGGPEWEKIKSIPNLKVI